MVISLTDTRTREEYASPGEVAAPPVVCHNALDESKYLANKFDTCKRLVLVDEVEGLWPPESEEVPIFE